ncbi:MAG: colanic acid biosynthesis protein WcaH, partial [Alphaproteobacteria bacterium]
MQLDDQKFERVIDWTPLVAIDLIIRDSKNRILLGRRVNEPARGKWFVPGGRIHKNECLDEAFERTSKAEIGEKFFRNEARLIGTFTHKYPTNVFLKEGISTHYVALAYEIHLPEELQVTMMEQHSEYRWFSRAEADPDICQNADPEVHEYTVEYFRIPSEMDEGQYQILNSRRDSFNSLLWQTPTVGLTAQAFLFLIILSGNVPVLGRTIAAVLAAAAALVSLHLFGKHRFMEEAHARILHAYEDIHKSYAANHQFKNRTWSLRW